MLLRLLLSLIYVAILAPLQAAERDAFAAAKALGRGINLGNALEAPKEGEWGVTLQKEYFTKIKQAGFDSVRLPVKWSAHAQKDSPYTIDKAFFQRIDWAIEQAKKNHLVIIVNAHHYDEVVRDPDAHLARLAGFWQQIAERYKDQPDSVYFELLNEPNSKLDDAKWNAEFPKILAIVRKTNPTRPVVIGPSQWSNVNNLANLKLPADDQHLIATFHYYSPFEFTHQGAPWQAGAEKWKGRKWPQSSDEEAKLGKDFELAAEWGKQEKRPVFLGEFGAFGAADMEQRVNWTAAVRKEAEKHGFSWAYWEFCSGFGAYDPDKNVWKEPLLEALVK